MPTHGALFIRKVFFSFKFFKTYLFPFQTTHTRKNSAITNKPIFWIPPEWSSFLLIQISMRFIPHIFCYLFSLWTRLTHEKSGIRECCRRKKVLRNVILSDTIIGIWGESSSMVQKESVQMLLANTQTRRVKRNFSNLIVLYGF